MIQLIFFLRYTSCSINFSSYLFCKGIICLLPNKTTDFPSDFCHEQKINDCESSKLRHCEAAAACASPCFSQVLANAVGSPGRGHCMALLTNAIVGALVPLSLERKNRSQQKEIPSTYSRSTWRFLFAPPKGCAHGETPRGAKLRWVFSP